MYLGVYFVDIIIVIVVTACLRDGYLHGSILAFAPFYNPRLFILEIETRNQQWSRVFYFPGPLIIFDNFVPKEIQVIFNFTLIHLCEIMIHYGILTV